MPVTREDVVAAYRLLLRREPLENETAIWLNVGSLAELRDAFWTSPEFRAQIPTSGSQRSPLDVPAIPVEWDVAPDTEARLLRHVTETWNALGTEEPHWSVLSDEAFKAHNLAHTRAAFYASGAGDAARVAATLARHAIRPADVPRVVEYGCGVGRVTPHLAGVFRDVTGVDISESHLALAREAIGESKRRNIRLAVARAPDFGMAETFDLWFSHIVLQHNPPPVIANVLRRMFSMLAPGGVAIFQVPTYSPGYRFNAEVYLAEPRQKNIEMHCLPQPVVFKLAAQAGCIPLEVREDLAMGYPWISNIFVFRKS